MNQEESEESPTLAKSKKFNWLVNMHFKILNTLDPYDETSLQNFDGIM